MRSMVPHKSSWALDRAIRKTGPETIDIYWETNQHIARIRIERVMRLLKWWKPLFQITIMDPLIPKQRSK